MKDYMSQRVSWRVTILAALAAFVISNAVAASWTRVSPWVVISGTDGTDPQPIKVDTAGGVNVSGGVAAGATDSGAPVKVGGVYNSTKPTLTNGQRGDIQLGTRGGIIANLYGADSATAIDATASTGDGLNAALNGYNVRSYPYKHNGSTWDKDFACTNQAQATITAGNTTQVIALGASQVIRVCSMSIGIATTGTVSVVQGTGSNCAGGTATIIPATTLTAGNVFTMGDGAAAVLRGGSGNAICVAAVTGNAQVFMSYAQY